MSSDLEGQSGAFYVDGSCRPHNPGYIGWGVHGYFYKEIAETAILVSNEFDSFQHTDNGYVGLSTPENLRPKNVQFVVPTAYIDGYGSKGELASNNYAEILAFYNLLEHLKPLKLNVVRVYTDSQYMRDCINEWCARWERNKWVKPDGSPVSNRELLEKTHNLLKEMKAAGMVLHLTWIRAHNGHVGNERADVLAGIGMNHSQKRERASIIETFDVKGYWKSEPDVNPYVAFRRLYFNSLEQYNQPGVYHLAESADADFVLGKPSASTGYSVVYLNDPDPVLETMKKNQYEWSRGLNVIVLMKLDSIYNKHVYPWLKKHGRYVVIGLKHSHSMEMVNRKPITVEMNPTGLSMRSLDHFAMLEGKLLGFKEAEQGDKHPDFLLGASKISVHEITDRFFMPITDKKGNVKYELRPEFIVGFRNMQVHLEIEHNGKPIPVKIPYALGYDCLPRNNLKYLESADPKIYMLTWPEGLVLRYCTIIVSKFGIGIWSNYFANQVLLPS